MSASHHLTQPSARSERQSGVALLTVLILLVVLAAASVALIQSQRGAVRQMADRLEVLDQNAASAVAHDACVVRMRVGIESAVPQADALAGFEGKTAFARTSDSIGRAGCGVGCTDSIAARCGAADGRSAGGTRSKRGVCRGA